LRLTRLWLARLMVLAISLLLGLVAIEALVRMTGRDRPLLWQPDPQLGWRHIPHAQLRWQEEGDGWVKINSLGFRDVERTVQKAPGTLRIAVFGDSTTEAVQVNLDQTFCQLLERKLRERGVRAEVMNFGVSGYGPLQSFLLYSHRVREFTPDVVLHAVFLDNDVADGDRRLAAGQRGAPFLKNPTGGESEIDYSAAAASADSYAREPVHTLRNISAVYRLMSAARARRTNAAAVGAATADAGHVPRRFLLYEDPLEGEWEDAWRTFERIVVRFSEAAKHDGARYVLLSVPAGQVVHPEVWQKLLQQYPAMSSRKWDVLSAEKRLQMLSEEHRIPLIAPLPTFVGAGEGEPLFFAQIGHLTPRGHQVMAALLERAIDEQQLLSEISAAAR
jgi:lysophospholipase L1-like esterase